MHKPHSSHLGIDDRSSTTRGHSPQDTECTAATHGRDGLLELGVGLHLEVAAGSEAKQTTAGKITAAFRIKKRKVALMKKNGMYASGVRQLAASIWATKSYNQRSERSYA